MAAARDVSNRRAIGAGLLGGVILATFLSRFGLPLGLDKLDCPDLVGRCVSAAFGLPEGKHVIVIGWILFALWGVGWSLIYAFYVSDRLAAPGWLQGLIYGGTGVFLVSSSVFLPLMRWAHSMFQAGQISAPGPFGLAFASGQMILANFLGHCLFGLLLGLVYRRRLVF